MANEGKRGQAGENLVWRKKEVERGKKQFGPLFLFQRGANIGTVPSPPSYSKMRSRDDLLFFFVGKVFSLVKPAGVQTSNCRAHTILCIAA